MNPTLLLLLMLVLMLMLMHMLMLMLLVIMEMLELLIHLMLLQRHTLCRINVHMGWHWISSGVRISSRG